MATITGTTPALASPGVGSGLDVNAIVEKLMAVEAQPVNAIASKVSADQSKISAFGTIRSALATLQGTMASLSTASAFRPLSANVGDLTSFSATIGTGASPGTYQVKVTQLAAAQKVASEGFASTSDSVGTGTLNFDFGTFAAGTFTSNGSGTKTVTIAAGQQSLTGIRDAVNAAKIGVTATIVNDGSAAGNRLVFTSAATGASNSMRITVADADGTHLDATGLSQLAYDPAGTAGNGRNMSQKVAAQNALLTIDGIDISKSSNTVTDAIQGVTLNLLKEKPDTLNNVTVAANTAAVGASVAAFVKAFNDLDTTFDTLTKYDATKKAASVLTGDSTIRTLQTQLRTLLTGTMGAGNMTNLSAVGISFKADGTLTLDNAKLTTALTNDPDGVTKLFAAAGSASDSQVSFSGYTAKTIPGTYGLNVSALATRASLTGSAIAGLTITAGVNDQLTVQLDGTSATVTLAAGTYGSTQALVAELQGKINGATAFASAGSTVAVSESGGVLTLRSQRYGSSSYVGLGGTAATMLVGATPSGSPGTDVTGTIDGTAGVGSGQTLTGATGTTVEGLKVSIPAGATGDRGTVTYATGFAHRLNDLLGKIIGNDGAIATRTKGLNDDIAALGKRKDALERRLALVEKNYRAQFTALDTLMANLGTTSTFLSQQLANLPKIGE